MSKIGNEVLRLEEEGRIRYDEKLNICVAVPEEESEKVEVRYGRS